MATVSISKSSIIPSSLNSSATYSSGTTTVFIPPPTAYAEIVAIIIDTPAATTAVNIYDPSGTIILKSITASNVSNSVTYYDMGSMLRVPGGCQVKVVVSAAISSPIVQIMATLFEKS